MRASFNRSFLVVMAAVSASALVACGGDSASTSDPGTGTAGNAGAAGKAGAAGVGVAGAAGSGAVAGAAGSTAAGSAGAGDAGSAGSGDAGSAGSGDAGSAGSGAAGAGDAGAAGAGDAGAAGSGDAGAAGSGDAGAAGSGDAGAAGSAGSAGTPCQVAGASCGDGKYCKPDTDTCSITGVCEDLPTACPIGCSLIGSCGCDGNVYCNSCAAAAAGVGVSADGAACKADVPCSANADCSGKAQYCSFDAADQCGKISKGVCRPTPTACSKELAPVCGCDGKDYGNACIAAAAGVSVAAEGTCAKGKSCTTNGECSDKELCQRGDGCAVPGECVAKPLLCTKELAPVCGCDGVVYDNACFAQQAGASVDTRSDKANACSLTAATCGGKTGKICAANQFCDYPDGSLCGAADQTGVCKARPGLCPLLKAPVCGCDGKTYGNACLAQQAGVDVSTNGACGTIKQLCGPGLKSCGQGSFCKFDSVEDACGYQTLGTCEATPAFCTKCALGAPAVCGCDGKTYCSECVAEAAGTSVGPASICAGQLPKKCDNNKGCAGTEFCDFTDGDVCGKQGQGICATKPVKCKPICEIQGVCGCDGKIYCSSCDAESAGVSVAPSGYCKGLPSL
jgi:hypothetical protein